MRKAFVPLILATALVIISGSTPLIPVASGASGTIKSTDVTGAIEINVFLPGDDVYAMGNGMWPGEYKIYIIHDTSIEPGMDILGPVTPPVSVTVGPDKRFSATLIWSAATPGNYDIIADHQTRGTRGVFDPPNDAKDDSEINVTAGFFVIPETSLGTISVLLASFSATLIIKRKRIFSATRGAQQSP